MAKQKQKNWRNVYALRQEYNRFQKRWFPIIVYWNCNRSIVWCEVLCTEDGSSYYHTNLIADYARVTRKGTDKCDQEAVKRMLEYYKAETKGDIYEVEKLGAYCPRHP